MNLKEAVGIRLKNLLNERNLNNYAVQKQGGVPRVTVGRVADAKIKTVKLDTLYQITQTLGISLGEFFSDGIFDEVTD
ncbi:MAG: helix-turn-helix domain-containing protein [Roseburia sp.]|nr:helix-turn-helix domain-containing protein [Roseburia sp.]